MQKLPEKAPDAYPMRINKYLALKGFSTRRGADELIEKKLVSINGRFAVLGDKVNATDKVEVSQKKKAENYVYYAYNKPVGITTGETRKGDKDISQSIQLKGVFPVGSLDKKDGGLIILTNDRRIIDRLENPRHAHVKKYMVVAREPLRANFKEKIEAGISLDGGPMMMPRVHMVSPSIAAITLTEPSNPIRAILSLFRAEAESITRTEIVNIQLAKMAPNSYRPISGEELALFLKNLGL